MKIKKILTLFGLLLYPCIALSIDSSIKPFADNRMVNIISFNEISRRLTDKKNITNVRQITANKDLKNRTYKRFNNKSEYKINDNCSAPSYGEACASSNLITMGTTSSYIDEYSVFAVIGTGIKLPEDQIESFNGIDD